MKYLRPYGEILRPNLECGFRNQACLTVIIFKNTRYPIDLSGGRKDVVSYLFKRFPVHIC